MKILLFGKNGQVGRALCPLLSKLGELVSMDSTQVCLSSPSLLWDVLSYYRPDIIVNAAAYTAVDKAETDALMAFAVNANAVAIISKYAKQHDALLVHYSTDYVFDGEKDCAYLERDTTCPQNIYGHSKLAGEHAIFQSGCRHFIFRTSWVYSCDGKNFVKTILRLAKERETLKIVADQYGAPTSAALIADITSMVMRNHQNIPYGLYHLAAQGKTTWYGLALTILQYAEEMGQRLSLTSGRLSPIATEEYPLPAKRPKNSCLDTGALSRRLGVEMLAWEMYLRPVVAQLTTAAMD